MIQPLIQYPGFASGDPLKVKHPGFTSGDTLRVAYPGIGVEQFESQFLLLFPLFIPEEE